MEIKEKEIIPIYLFNLMLMGDFKTGKTCFLFYYKKNIFYNLINDFISVDFVRNPFFLF